MTVKKSYYYFYYRLYKFFILFGEDFLIKYKPVTFLIFLEVLLLSALDNWYTIIARRWDIKGHLMLLVIITIFISLFNYSFFLVGDKYKKYFFEFESYPKQKNIIAGWIAFLLVSLIITTYIISDYQMGLIDWKK